MKISEKADLKPQLLAAKERFAIFMNRERHIKVKLKCNKFLILPMQMFTISENNFCLCNLKEG